MGPPLHELVGRFQRDAAPGAGAKVVDRNLGGLLQVHPSAGQQPAAFAAQRVEQVFVADGRQVVELVARLQAVSVAVAHPRQQVHRHVFLIVGIAADAAAGRQVVAGLGDGDARPQHARRVEQVEVAGQLDALFDLGDARLVTGLGRALAVQGVDQGRLADVGNAADQHPQRLDHAAAQRCQRPTRLDQLARRRCRAGVERQCVGADLGLVVRQPQGGAFGVGQVLLVEDLQGRLAAGQVGQQGVGAGARQPGIEQFDDDVDVGQAFGDGLLRRMHVTGKPLNGHEALPLCGCRLGWTAPCDCRGPRSQAEKLTASRHA